MDLWDKTILLVGTLEVKARKTVVRQESGTAITAVAYARDKDDFASKVADVLYEQGFDVMSVGEIEHYENRLRRGDVDDAMREKAESLNDDHPVAIC